MKISIKGSTTVCPAQDTPSQHLWISALDLRMMQRRHVPLLYFYKPTGSSDFFQAQVLKEALSKILVPFYPVAGRLGRDESGRIEIVCNAEGVLFLEAEAVGILDDLGGFAPSSKLQQLLPTVNYSGDISSYPLLLIQVTTFKCGGVSLGIHIHHALGDGTSLCHFINSWSDMARGQSLNVSPFLDRTVLHSLVPPAPSFRHVEYDSCPSMITPISFPGSLSTSVFKITQDHLNNLKAKCYKNGTTITKYSTYNILAAHVWRCVSKARCLLHNQATKLSMTVNGRPRLRPPLPSGYFGNVIFRASTIALSGDLQTEPLMKTVERIHTALNQMDDAYLKSALAYLEKVPINQISSSPSEHEQQCPNLFITSLRLPIHDANFGWGHPIFMGRGSIGEGMIYILPSPTDDGSWTLIAGLETSHMKLFQQLICQKLICNL
ncbi:hypothetical protein SLA2020_004900 [Shorea laevis]